MSARLVDDRVVAVGGREIAADYLVIATGSSVHVPDLPGIGDVSYMTSADVLDATTLPDSGIVMGFGNVGLELVPYLAELGVVLTVIEHDARPLDEADPAFGDALLELYREEWGIEVLTDTGEERLEPAGGGVRLHTDRADDRATVEADEGTVLGYQGLHYHADTVAKTAQVLVENGLDVRDLPDRAYHPTLPEIIDGLIRDATEQL